MQKHRSAKQITAQEMSNTLCPVHVSYMPTISCTMQHFIMLVNYYNRSITNLRSNMIQVTSTYDLDNFKMRYLHGYTVFLL